MDVSFLDGLTCFGFGFFRFSRYKCLAGVLIEAAVMKWAYFLSSLLLFGFLAYDSSATFTPADNHLIACGSSQNVYVEGRIFIPDSRQSAFLLKSQGDSVVVVAGSNSSVLSPIYQSLRVFTAPSSYEFDIQAAGWHWVRLYFHPLPSSEHNLNSASITVTTEKFVLLRNFTFRDRKNLYLFKEYLINVTSHTLILRFVPANNSVAFVSGIEVVSVPDDLISDESDLSPSFTGFSEHALETVYRLNMGGPLLTPQNDTLGRTWENDQTYLHVKSSAVNVTASPGSIKYPPKRVTPQTAPNWVYATAEAMADANVPNWNFNITWVLHVDPSFSYFVRLHFCDIVSQAMNELFFNVYINSNIAIPRLDLSTKTGGLEVPYYKDFVANSSSTSGTISISVGPDMFDAMNATLNGVEIMKISNEAQSLDGMYPVEGLLFNLHKKSSKMEIIIVASAGALAAIGLVVLCYCYFMVCRSKSSHRGHLWLPLPLHGNSHTMTRVSTLSQKSGTASCISLASSSHGRVFTFQEIMDSTNKFDENLLLGVGGFGKVYKGTLEDGTRVAVKRGNSRSEQGLAEFHTEIEMLSKLRHRHLVSLIGYCDERSEMILVYEYMANGPLRSHLYGTDLPSLSWKQRLEICIGAARGLHYLHTGAAQSIIHRDVKTTNILLDENYVAKVADFGLSKTGPALDQTHVSTAVKGSFGYLDPEYFRRQQLTEKSDVYSFGVVLMEVLCSRPALNPILPREQVNIAEWAMSWQRKGMLDHIMDQFLVGKVNPASLRKFGETAEKCLAEQGIDRPTMGDVLWNLEYALQLEETSSLTDVDENSTNHIADIPLTPLESFSNSISMVGTVNAHVDDDSEDAATSAVFSQLVNPRGR